MKLRRRLSVTILASLGLVSSVAACASLFVPDLKTDNQLGSEAGAPDVASIDAGPQDPCHHVVPPPKPDHDDGADILLPDINVILHTVQLVAPLGYDASVFDGSPAPRTTIGFDLDNACTCEVDLHRAGTNSCLQPKGASLPCDTDGGIDNQLPTLLGNVQLFAKKGTSIDDLATINERIQGGDSSLMLTIQRYNGLANDQDVQVIMRGVSRPSRWPLEGGACAGAKERPLGDPTLPDSGGFDASWLARGPAWDGCDVWDIFEETTPAAAWVNDHVLSVIADATVPVLIGGAAVDVVFPRFTGVLVPDGHGGFTLEDGQFAGRAPITPLLNVARRFSVSSEAGPICGTPSEIALVAFVCGERDIASSTSLDYYPMEVACDSMSVAYAYRADPANTSGNKIMGVFSDSCAEAGAVQPCPQ